MRTQLLSFFCCFFIVGSGFLSAQTIENKPQKAKAVHTLNYKYVPSIAEQIRTGTFIPGTLPNPKQEINPRKRHGADIIIGKGSSGKDRLIEEQLAVTKSPSRAPSLVFTTTTSAFTPSDPTGAVGRDFYVAAWNTSWQIFDKDGTPAAGMPNPASLGTLFSGRDPGDPIVLYDSAADRYVIIQFDGPLVGGPTNGFHIAISQSNDPINDGWHVYSPSDFGTNAFPDYEKISIWSDGYYMTANIGTNEVWALERDKMLAGDPTASIQTFGIPGWLAATGGFSSPHFLNVTDDNLPAAGGATLVFQQDDAYPGVATDHVKLWNLDVDWVTPGNSVISAPIEIGLTSFNAVFDGGAFDNLTQPTGGPDIDALQALIGNQAQFRKFGSHNSALFSFVVDVGGGTEQAAVRWVELRQTADGQPWTLYQEGTYVAPDGRHAWNASLAMDVQGNIGMGYTTMAGSTNTNITSAYTGQLVANSGSGTMGVAEEFIQTSTAGNPSFRYADYSHLTVDPSDDKGFWFVNELFTPSRSNVVGVFQLAPNNNEDVGVTSIDTPMSGALSNSETITVTVFNFGENDASGFNVTYQIDGGAVVTEAFPGTLASQTSQQFVFATTADFSTEGNTYSITSCTDYGADEDNANDCTSMDVTHELANDVGVTAITSPMSGENLGMETVTVTIENFGTQDQTGFDVNYIVDGGTPVVETVGVNVPAGGSVSFDFAQMVDISTIGTYEFTSSTLLGSDSDNSNDMAMSTVVNVSCVSDTNSTVQNVGPDGGTETLSVASIGSNFSVEDVNVTVNISHTFVGDLTIKLIAPDGVTEVLLADGVGGSGNDYIDTVFDDAATDPIATGTAPFTGSFQPAGNLSDFNGLSSFGDWTLSITDNFDFDGGALNSWTLQVCGDIVVTNNDVGITAITAPTSGEGLNNETISVTVSNFGDMDQTGFDVNYSVNGGAAVVETVGTNVAAGSSITYDFAQTADFSAIGAYTISSSTLLAGDEETTNDEFMTTVSNFACETEMNDTVDNVGPDGGTTTTSVITLTDDFPIDDINVTVDITHTWVSDLDIRLIAPDGITEVTLASGVGGSGDDFAGTTFDDEAATLIGDGDAPFSGTFQPDGNLSDFNGMSTMGDWTLSITDNFDGDGGTLNSWSIQYCGNTNLSIDENELGGELQVIHLGDDQYDIILPMGTLSDQMNFRVFNLLGQVLLDSSLEPVEGVGYRYRLDMSYAASGIYVIEVTNGDSESVKRFIVE